MTDYEEVKVEVALSSGKILVCRRIPPNDMELFEDYHIEPKPPGRETTAAGGVTEIVPDTDDEGYQQRLVEFRTKKVEDLRRMIFTHVEFKDPPTQEEIEKLRSWGIEPTKENLIRHYMTDSFVDWLVIREEVMRISTVTEDEVQRALERFQRRMGRGTPNPENGHPKEPVQSRRRKSVGTPGS